MTVASAIGSDFGIADETVYGTFVSPTRWYDTKDKLPDLKLVKNTAQGGGLAGGRMAQPSTRRVVTTQAGAIGSLPMEILNTKAGLLLKHVFGGAVSPVQQASSTAYLQTHPLADNVGRFFTGQVQIPQTDGTIKAFTGRGGKVTSAEFSCEVDGLLMVDIAADFQKVVDSDAAGTASYPATQWPFHFGQMNVKLGTSYGSESAVSGVRKVSLKIDRSQAVDRFYAGGLGLKAEPLMNGFVAVSGSMDVDFVDKTAFADRFRDDAQTAIVLEWVASTAIESTYFPTFRLKVPAAFFDDGTPTVDDAGVPKTTFNWVARYDMTNALVTAEYMSTDTVL